ncbi:ER membrane protein complex subunit 8/9 homolog [Microplitis mediator]|uniref:ER membrane protein complex subunit 8/9 homolog n=1 Tax=Microplitis mediator TaxID=375433 RepID=UPI0025553156|nr:ER membrane protein complex subunit 8/9 homolog [Microplitis mediator]
MSKISISPRACSKIILHAAKYPHCAINGLLLAKQKNKNDSKPADLLIQDAIPLFHQCLHVSPMAEIALTMVDQFAEQNGMVIAGYYLANELVNDMSTDKPAHRIADKIAENFNNALLVVIDNKELTFNMNSVPFKISQYADGKWKVKDKADILNESGDAVIETISILLKEERYQNLIDFDNHLDNISLDWQNNELNKIINKTLAYSNGVQS